MAIPRLLFAMSALCLLALAPVPSAAAADPPYPRLGLYGHVDGRGWPLIRSNGQLDALALDEVARHHTVVLDATPFTEYRPDALAALRARRSDITLLGYVQGQYAFPANEADSTVNLPTRLHIVVRNLNGYLYAKTGAEAMADFFRDQVLVPGGWDGLFLDSFCNSILWDQTPTDSLDYVRAGYASLAAFDAAWLVALESTFRRIGGRLDTAVNDGAIGNSVLLEAGAAVFLLRAAGALVPVGAPARAVPSP